MRLYNRPVFFVIVALFALPACAQQPKPLPYGESSVELAALPDYCQARLGGNSVLYEKWNQRMGPDKFIHVHHFCHGLNYAKRARATFDKYLRNYYLGIAETEFDYVIQRWPNGFELKAEAQRRKQQLRFMKM